jgi:hypothetical protein
MILYDVLGITNNLVHCHRDSGFVQETRPVGALEGENAYVT